MERMQRKNSVYIQVILRRDVVDVEVKMLLSICVTVKIIKGDFIVAINVMKYGMNFGKATEQSIN
jgi:hypothetical protein